MCGQETAFKKWAAEVFKVTRKFFLYYTAFNFIDVDPSTNAFIGQVALETFCLENEDDTLNQIDQMLHDVKLSASTVRFRDTKEEAPLNGICLYFSLTRIHLLRQNIIIDHALFQAQHVATIVKSAKPFYNRRKTFTKTLKPTELLCYWNQPSKELHTRPAITWVSSHAIVRNQWMELSSIWKNPLRIKLSNYSC